MPDIAGFGGFSLVFVVFEHRRGSFEIRDNFEKKNLARRLISRISENLHLSLPETKTSEDSSRFEIIQN